jgi:hypothetical protein
MTELTIQSVSSARRTATAALQLDSAKLDDAFLHHHVGSP